MGLFYNSSGQQVKSYDVPDITGYHPAPVAAPPPVDNKTLQKYHDFVSTTKQGERDLFFSHLNNLAQKGDARSKYLLDNLKPLTKGIGTNYNTSLMGKLYKNVSTPLVEGIAGIAGGGSAGEVPAGLKNGQATGVAKDDKGKPMAGKTQSVKQLSKDTAVSGLEAGTGTKILGLGLKLALGARAAGKVAQIGRAAQASKLDDFITANDAPKGLPAPAETATPKGLPSAGTSTAAPKRTPGGAIMVDSGSKEAQILKNAGKPTKIGDNPARPGQNVTDITAPKVTKEQVTAAGRKVADGSLIQGSDTAPAPKKNLDTLMQRWSDLRSGKVENTSRIGHINTLNDVIEHPHASQAVKDQAMAERDTLMGKNMQDKLATEHSIETGQPVAAAHETLQAGHTPRGAIYQDVQQLIDERAPQAKKAVPQTEPLPEPTQPAKQTLLGGLVTKVTKKANASGLVNPQRGAAREGNLDLAKVGHQNIVDKNLASHDAAEQAATYDKQRQAEGLTHDQVIKLVESGRAGESKAATMFKNLLDEVGQQGVESKTLKGMRENYVPRLGKFEGSRGGADAYGLSKSHRFNNERQTIETVDEHGNVTKTDKYPTHAEFKAAVEKLGGKVQGDTAKLLEHTLRTQRHAIENARTIDKLERTPMRDGRPAVITVKEGESLKYKDYKAIDGLPGRYVHPEAKRLLDAISKGGAIDNELARGVTRFNSTGKRLVTLNGLVHAKNFALAGMRNQGFIRTLISPFKNYSAEDVRRAISNGFEPSKISSSSLFDEFGHPSPRLGKLGEVLGKLRNKSDRLLFEHFGDSVGMSTYLHIEKRLAEDGLSHEEAGKVASEFANQTIFAIPKDQQSIATRQASQLALFAGKYLQNTMKIGTNAFGVGIDKTLSSDAQRATQHLAIESAVRGMTYLFVTAQAINYRATGRFTWQNKGSKMEPVFWTDKTTGKEYHITNFYGQLGEFIKLFNNPGKEMTNKLAPGAKEIMQQGANYDQFKGKNIADPTTSGLHQTVQRVIHAADTLFTPLGFQASATNRIVGSTRQPAAVTAAKLFGFGSSSADRNKLETDINNAYTKTLPAGNNPTQTEQQLYKDEAAARHDLQSGKTDSLAITKVKGQMSPEQFKTFMKTGSLNDTQRQFDKLPDDQKLQIIESHNPKDLKEINFDSLAKALLTNKTAIDSLKQKGYTAEQLKADLQKAGVGSDQYARIQKAAKDQAKASSKASAHNRKVNGKWKSPLLQ